MDVMCVAIQGIQKPFVYRVRFSSNSDVASNKRALIHWFRFRLLGALTLRNFLLTKISSKTYNVLATVLILCMKCFSVNEEEKKS